MKVSAAEHFRALGRQFSAFFGVGIAAAIVHYGLLVSLVEGYRMEAVRATLVGYVGGGIVSYLLNRRHTYASDRPHLEASWRFALVALVGFGVTWVFMALFVRVFGLPYLPAQIVTTGIVLVWSFLAHKLWTFRDPPAFVP
jgi:putative flippase GtrA